MLSQNVRLDNLAEHSNIGLDASQRVEFEIETPKLKHYKKMVVLRRNNFVAKIVTNSSQNGGKCKFDFFATTSSQEFATK